MVGKKTGLGAKNVGWDTGLKTRGGNTHWGKWGTNIFGGGEALYSLLGFFV